MKKVTVGALLLGVVILAVVAVPVVQAAPLLSQVNQAMRDAGIAVTRLNQLGWGEGVMTGHYKTFGQLVSAMKWHKQQGRTIPDSSKFTKGAAAAVAAVTGTTKCINRGEVASLSSKAIAIKISGGTKTLRLTKQQYDVLIGRSVQVGSTVKVCTKDNFKNLAGNVIGLANLANDGGGGGGGSKSGGGS